MPGLRFSTGRGGFETRPYIQVLATTEPWFLFRHGPRISAGASSLVRGIGESGMWLVADSYGSQCVISSQGSGRR